MKRFATLLPVLALSAGLGSVMFPAQAVELPLDARQIEAMGLAFAVPERIREVPGPAWSGRVKLPPVHRAEVVAPVAGRVRTVQHLHGPVRTGEVLLILESDELRQLQQDWLATLAELKPAQEEYRRARRLYKAGSLSRKKFLQAEQRYTVLGDRAGAQRGRLVFAGMTEAELTDLEKRRDLNGMVRLRAPRDGFLAPMDTVPGRRVQRGERLSVVSDTAWIAVHIPVPAAVARRLEPGQGVVLDQQGRRGEIAWIGRSVDPRTLRVSVHARFDNADGSLLAGELVRVRFLAGQAKGRGAWRLPAAGLVEVDGAPTVFRRTPQGAEPIPVEVLARDAERVVVRPTGNLDDADGVQLLTRGAVYLKPMLEGGEE